MEGWHIEEKGQWEGGTLGTGTLEGTLRERNIGRVKHWGIRTAEG